MTYDEGVKLVYLAFRLLIVYRVILCGIVFVSNFHKLVEACNRSKELKMKYEREKNTVEKERIRGIERSNYKSTKIGFVTTPIIDKKE